MLRYGTDRPDTRFGLEIARPRRRCSAASEFKVFAGALESGGVVRGDQRRRARAAALASSTRSPSWRSARRQGPRVGVRRGRRRLALADREVPLRGRDRRRSTSALGGAAGRPAADRRRRRRRSRPTVLGALRLELARALRPRPARAATTSLWVVDFPMFEWNDERAALGRRSTTRSPRPSGDLEAIPGALRSRAYDLVLDGRELGGGSIRINRADVQQQVLELLGIERRGGAGALRLPARRARVRRAAARRDRVRHRPDRRAARRSRLDPRRDRLPEDRDRRRPADRRPGPGGPAQLRELGLKLAAPPAAPSGS